MSLTVSEKKICSFELFENFKVLGYEPKTIQNDLSISSKELMNTLNIGDMANPTMVWKLRDYMEEKILEQGKTPYPYSVLKNNIYFPYKKDWN